MAFVGLYHHLHVGGKKPGLCPKGCRGKVVRVLHFKAGEETDG